MLVQCTYTIRRLYRFWWSAEVCNRAYGYTHGESFTKRLALYSAVRKMKKRAKLSAGKEEGEISFKIGAK